MTLLFHSPFVPLFFLIHVNLFVCVWYLWRARREKSEVRVVLQVHFLKGFKKKKKTFLFGLIPTYYHECGNGLWHKIEIQRILVE